MSDFPLPQRAKAPKARTTIQIWEETIPAVDALIAQRYDLTGVQMSRTQFINGLLLANAKSLPDTTTV